MLAKEAHHAIEAQVAQAPALWARAVDLKWPRIEWVRLESPALGNHRQPVEVADFLRVGAAMHPEGISQRDVALWREASSD